MHSKNKNKFLFITALILSMTIIISLVISTGCSSKKEKIYHVGILSGSDLFTGIADSFKQEMESLGYIEGKNIVYDYQKTNYEPEKDREILRGFVDNNVDLIFGFNTEVAIEAKEAARKTGTQVVFANAFTEETILSITSRPLTEI